MPTYFDPRTERALSEEVAEALRYIEQNVPKTLVGTGRSVLTKALVDAASSGERDPCALEPRARRLNTPRGMIQRRAPLAPQREHRTRWRSTLLEASQPHRMMTGASARGAWCGQALQ
jgi:hypothetical protein